MDEYQRQKHIFRIIHALTSNKMHPVVRMQTLENLLDELTNCLNQGIDKYSIIRINKFASRARGGLGSISGLHWDNNVQPLLDGLVRYKDDY